MVRCPGEDWDRRDTGRVSGVRVRWQKGKGPGHKSRSFKMGHRVGAHTRGGRPAGWGGGAALAQGAKQTGNKVVGADG